MDIQWKLEKIIRKLVIYSESGHNVKTTICGDQRQGWGDHVIRNQHFKHDRWRTGRTPSTKGCRCWPCHRYVSWDWTEDWEYLTTSYSWKDVSCWLSYNSKSSKWQQEILWAGVWNLTVIQIEYSCLIICKDTVIVGYETCMAYSPECNSCKCDMDLQ